MVHFDVKPSF